MVILEDPLKRRKWWRRRGHGANPRDEGSHSNRWVPEAGRS